MTEPSPATPAGSRNPFTSPRFRRWWMASFVAGTGVGIQAVTVPLYIRDRVDSEERALAISTALIAQTLPAALVVLFGGTAADRIEHRRILVRTYAVGAVVSMLYVWLCLSDSGLIWPVYPLAALVGTAGAFTNPTRQSMLPQIVAPEALPNGVILGTMGFMASLQFVGPALGGLATEAFGLASAFSIEVAFLVLGALAFSTIRTRPPPPSDRKVLHDLADGLRYVAGEPALLGVLLLAAVPGIFFIGPFAVTLPILVPDVFGATDLWVGLLWGCFGGGVVAGSIGLTLRPLPHRGRALCVSIVAGGLVLVAYSQSRSLALSAALLVVWGLGASIFINYAVVLLQTYASPPLIGRVMSMYTLMFLASSPLGYFQAGQLTTAIGAERMMLLSGCVAAVVGVTALLFLKPVRELE